VSILVRPAAVLPIVVIWGTFSAPGLQAASFTFEGQFTRDDETALFDFTTAAANSVQIRTFGYAGGITATGTVVPRGGFDPVLTLFDTNGVFLQDNDESSGVPVDPLSGQAADALLDVRLQPGDYIVALTQYDNVSIGHNLGDGFREQGNPHFTADPNFSAAGPCPEDLFRDTSGGPGRCRNGNWAVDFVNVSSATERNVSPVPEPRAFYPTILSLLVFLRWRGQSPQRPR
jgi:hypothetical protein